MASFITNMLLFALDVITCPATVENFLPLRIFQHVDKLLNA